MKKSILLIIAILTTSCAACLAGCAKNNGKAKAGLRGAGQQTVSVEETPDGDNAPDGGEQPDRECPDGNCGRKGPHTFPKRKHNMPVIGDFRFILEITPHCRHDRRRPPKEEQDSTETPGSPEELPTPDDGETN